MARATDPELRDVEIVPYNYDGGIEEYVRTEVLPYTEDAWIDDDKTQIGYEVSFTKYFYRPIELRSVKDIVADINSSTKERDDILPRILEGLV